MADIELVIKIPEETYEYWKNSCYSHKYVFAEAIKNGTQLPKGHGRLIDADALEYWKNNRPDEINYHFVPKYELDNAPTIIEADKEQE